jgi:hypothetical protein
MALTETQMTDSAENVAGPWRYERIDGPGHWVQLEAPDTINQLLLDSPPDRGFAGQTVNHHYPPRRCLARARSRPQAA